MSSWRPVHGGFDLRSGLVDRGGATAIEFALVAPLLIVLLLGVIAYGGYFLLAHAVQQLASDAARAAVGGLDDAERRTLAANCVASEIQSYGFLKPSLASLQINDQPPFLSVQLAYDASNSPPWSVSGLVPMPSTTIVRTAAIQLGGY